MTPDIRIATPEDAADIRAIYAPYVESTPISFETEPPTTAEMEARIETTRPRYPWLVCESDDGAILGYAAAGSLRSTPPYAWTAELTVYVPERAQRSGVGTALYTSLLAVLREQGYYNACAVITLPNPGSVRLHEKLDFDPIGTVPAIGYKQGEWHDIQWWYRRLAERPSVPEPPQPLDAIRGTSELERAVTAGETRLDD